MKLLVPLPLLLIFLFVAIPVPRQRLYPAGFNSVRICDRNGELLREVLSFDHKTSVWVPLERASSWMIKATTLREDKRFLLHPGIDVLAFGRAVHTNIKQGRIVSGGSTITMQVAKMALGLKSRSIPNKILEAVCALKLELQLSKAQILEIYLNRIPYGNRTYGIEAAARFYFGKGCGQLSLAESCMLATIPSAPSLMNPYVNRGRVDKARRKLLHDLLKQGAIDQTTHDVALREQLNLINQRVNFEAPHFVDYILGRLRQEDLEDAAKVITTIDLALQQKTEQMLSTTLQSLDRYQVSQGAVVIASAKTGEVLAMVGSRNYFDATEGQVNGCTSARQPGSSMKPFLYALALMSGMSLSDHVPDTIVEFRLRDGSSFAPRNYGQKYHGPTRMREALASSFNVAAVHLIDQLGIERFYALLKQFGFQSLTRGAHHYGLSLSLGAGEVTLLELVNGYRAFARQGMVTDLTCIREVWDRGGGRIARKGEERERVLPAEVAYLITDVLSDNTARFKAFGANNPLHLPFACAVKTGTSKDYRDNWCIGYTTDYVVGVWVGNFSGAPMQGISGITGAAPLFRDIMIELHRDGDPAAFACPAGLKRERICLFTGRRARADCSNQMEELFLAGTMPLDSCDCGVQGSERMGVLTAGLENERRRRTANDLAILNPGEGDVFKIDPHISAESQRIKFMIRASDSIESIMLKLNGSVITVAEYPFEFLWPPVRGEHVLEAVVEGDGIDARDRVAFVVY
ncbi:penicillin-binding protein 1C [candidate division WOR-3 bacterium]|nr:penicillin-binding protein 1C [candidate division WOR-3 bacterium]